MNRCGWAALAALVGCASGPADVTDAGVPATDAALSCAIGPLYVLVYLGHSNDGGTLTDANVSAIATATSGAFPRFVLGNGATVGVSVEGAAPFPVIAPGTQVHLIARADGPGDIVIIHSMSRPTDAGFGQLLYAAWEGTPNGQVHDLRLDDLAVSYATDSCGPSDLTIGGLSCGPGRSRTLTVVHSPTEPGRDAGTAVVGAGTSASLGAYRIVNGQSHQYTEFRCADLPDSRSAGAIFIP